MTAEPFAPPLVLFIDDDRHLEATFGSLFAAQGLRHASAPTGFAAHEIALRLLPDIIVIASAVGGADAVLMIEQLRMDAATRHTPSVVLTRSANRLFMERLLAAGATEIVPEPAAPPQVFEVVRRRARLTPGGRQVLELRRHMAQSREQAAAQHTSAVAMRTRVAELFVRMQEIRMAMVAADSSAECVAVNSAACALAGWPRDDILGHKVWEFTPGGGASAEPRWAQFLGSGLFDGSCAVLRADRTVLEVDLYAAADILPGLHVAAFEPEGVAAT